MYLSYKLPSGWLWESLACETCSFQWLFIPAARYALSTGCGGLEKTVHGYQECPSHLQWAGQSVSVWREHNSHRNLSVSSGEVIFLSSILLKWTRYLIWRVTESNFSLTRDARDWRSESLHSTTSDSYVRCATSLNPSLIPRLFPQKHGRRREPGSIHYLNPLIVSRNKGWAGICFQKRQQKQLPLPCRTRQP